MSKNELNITLLVEPKPGRTVNPLERLSTEFSRGGMVVPAGIDVQPIEGGKYLVTIPDAVYRKNPIQSILSGPESYVRIYRD